MHDFLVTCHAPEFLASESVPLAPRWNVEFTDRTNRLAEKHGINVQDLPGVIGISRASLFAFRSGKRAASFKALYRLEQAERAAGLNLGDAGK